MDHDIKRAVADAVMKLLNTTAPDLQLAALADVLDALGAMVGDWTGETVRIRMTAEGKGEMLGMTRHPAGIGSAH